MSAALKLEKFGGMLPAWDDKLLPEGQAAASLNTYLFSGALTGWRKPTLLRALVNSAARFVYRVPTVTRARATAVLTLSANANEGDTVKVGEETYTFTATVSAAYSVLLGASKEASAANLFAALTSAGTVGTTYGTGTEPNPVLTTLAGLNTQVGAVVTLTAADYGEAYNTTPVTESSGGVRMSWANPTFTGGLNTTFDSAITGSATWLEFEDPLTDVMRSLTVNDQYNRYYYASPSLPPRYNTYDRIQLGSDPWLLGVPAVGCAPAVSVSGGGASGSIGFDESISATDASSTPGGNRIVLVPVTPIGQIQLDTVSFMPADDQTTVAYFGVLYSDLNGVPDTLLNVGTEERGTTTSTEAISTFINPTSLTSGVQYWIGFVFDSNAAIFHADDTGTQGKVAVSTYSNGAPTTAPAMTATYDFQIWGDTTTGGVLAARAYLYTYVTEYGEEGPPSPATIVNGWSNGTWTVSLYEPPADERGVTRNITKKRLYRTISSSGGLTTYFYVTELEIADETYVDTNTDDLIALNGQLESTLWFPPPSGLKGIMAMPNGMAVGFKDNELWFCEPYRPHAWPPSYVLTTEYPIVGIGVIGQAVVAATSGTPCMASGVHPSSMAVTKIDLKEPCISKRSVLSVATGVFYASPNGLIRVKESGDADNTSEMWITREKWRELTPYKSLHAVLLSSCYFAFGVVDGDDATVAQDGFTIALNEQDAQSFSMYPQPGGHRLGLSTLSAPDDVDVSNLLVDPWSGAALILQDTNVYYYDFSDTEPEMMPYLWRSKKFHAKFSKNLEAMRVYFTVPTNTPTQAADRDTDATQPTLGANQYGIIRVYADDILVTTREIRTSGEILRILSGFKAEQWQFEIEARVYITNVQVATTLRDLSGV